MNFYQGVASGGLRTTSQYNGKFISDFKTLKNAIDPLNRLRVEHEFQAFYNFHLMPWLRLTGDLQVIRPTRTIADTAIVPGARLEIIF